MSRGIITRQTAISALYPDLASTDITLFAITLREGNDETRLVYLWLPRDEVRRAALLREEAKEFKFTVESCEELSADEISDQTGSD